MLTMENISVRPPLNVALKAMRAECRTQREKGTAPLNPACYLLDNKHLTDNAIERAAGGGTISSNEKHYGKVDTDLLGFSLDKPERLHVMVMDHDANVIHPISEKRGGGPTYQWKVAIKFDDLVPFTGPDEGEKGIGEHDLNLLHGALLPHVLVGPGNGQITYDSVDPISNKVLLSFEGSASGARNLEKYARVWRGGCEEYSVNLIGVKPNFFTELPKHLLHQLKKK